MRTKKFISVVLAGVTAVGLLAGCGSANNTSSAGGGSISSTSTTQTSQSEASETDNTVAETESVETTESGTQGTEEIASEGGKTLVVYYSASGRTRDVSETIADAAGADIFEVVPTEPYTDEDLNWTNNDSRVSREHDDESLRDVELTTTEVPVWWGIAAWPLDNFVKDNDFTGKTVIPFCTSASSGIGDSGNLLEEMAGTGDWQDGQRFHSNASASDVQAWVEELGLAK